MKVTTFTLILLVGAIATVGIASNDGVGWTGLAFMMFITIPSIIFILTLAKCIGAINELMAYTGRLGKTVEELCNEVTQISNVLDLHTTILKDHVDARIEQIKGEIAG